MATLVMRAGNSEWWCAHLKVHVKLCYTVNKKLVYKEVKPVSSKRNQPCIVIGSTIAEGEAPILWPPASKS